MTIYSRRKYSGTQVSDVLLKTSRTIGRDAGLHLVMVGDGAKTNGKVITLPALRDDAEVPVEELMVLDGYNVHETGHVLHTDFKVWGNGIESRGKKRAPLMFSLMNPIEDGRIEACILANYPGAIDALRATCASAFSAEKRAEEGWQEAKATVEATGNPIPLLGAAIACEWRRRMGYGACVEEYLAEVPEVCRQWAERIVDKAMAECRLLTGRAKSEATGKQYRHGKPGTADTVRVAQEFFDELMREFGMKQVPPQQQQDEAEEDEGRGDASGKGQGDSSAADDDDRGDEDDGDGHEGDDGQGAAGDDEDEDDAGQGGEEGEDDGDGGEGRGHEDGSEGDGEDEDEGEGEDGAGDADGDGAGEGEGEEAGDEAAGDDEAAEGDEGDDDDGDGQSSAGGEGDEDDRGEEEGAAGGGEGDGDEGDGQMVEDESFGTEGSVDDGDLQPGDVAGKYGTGNVGDGELWPYSRSFDLALDRRSRVMDESKAWTIGNDSSVTHGNKMLQAWLGGVTGGQQWQADEQAMRGVSSVLASSLERALAAKDMRGWDDGRLEGRLDTRRLTQAYRAEPAVWRQREEREELNTAVQLVIDQSASMDERKCAVARQAVVALSKALDGVGVPYEVLGYQSQWPALPSLEMREQMSRDFANRTKRGQLLTMLGNLFVVIKGFDEAMDVTAKAGVGALVTDGACDGGTPTWDAVRWAWQRMRDRMEERKVMVVLTDGDPGDGSTSNQQEQKQRTRDVVEAVVREGCQVIGIGLLMKGVERFFPEHLTVMTPEALPAALVKTLEAVLVGEAKVDRAGLMGVTATARRAAL